MPFTMISPAAAGGIRNAFFAMALRRATSSGDMPLGTPALSAIEVAMPPGWTTVTPTFEPSSSYSSEFENPRTANLLAE